MTLALALATPVNLPFGQTSEMKVCKCFLSNFRLNLELTLPMHLYPFPADKAAVTQPSAEYFLCIQLPLSHVFRGFALRARGLLSLPLSFREKNIIHRVGMETIPG